MANKLFPSQFSYSFERQLVNLVGSFTQTDLGAAAARTLQGITITANRWGSAGNTITVAFTSGGTAGAEVVSVAGRAISVQIQSGVSTVTQVRTALNLSAAAAVLMTAAGTSGSTVVTASALALQSGDDTDFTRSSPRAGMVVFQTGTGLYEIQLASSYNSLLSSSIMVQKATAADLQPQMISASPASAQTVSFRLVAGATPTNLANGDALYIQLELRNSSS